jgi:formyl-CoA transferase
MWLMRERDFSWGAMPHTGAFETTDGALVIVGAFKANPLREISLALGLGDLSQDARFDSFDNSVRNRTALHDILRARIRTNSTAHLIARLEVRDLLCAPVKRLGEALADRQTDINGMLVRHDQLGLVGSPVHLSSGGFALCTSPPALERTARRFSRSSVSVARRSSGCVWTGVGERPAEIAPRRARNHRPP